MRPDMKDVLITPGRYGSKKARNDQIHRLRKKPVEDDEIGFKQHMRPKNVDYDLIKHYNKSDYLSPLRNYLFSKVGSKWDDVYSEIKKNNPSQNAVGAHIYEHLWEYVAQNPWFDDQGSPYRFVWKQERLYYGKGDLYIDQEGYLREAQDIPKSVVEKRIVLYTIDKTTYAVCSRSGIWYLFKYSNRYKKIEGIRKRWKQEYAKDDQGNFLLDEKGRYIWKTTEWEEPFISYEPYFKIAQIPYEGSWAINHKKPEKDQGTFELLPGFSLKQSPYAAKPVKPYYLISAKQMSTKEKRKWGII